MFMVNQNVISVDNSLLHLHLPDAFIQSDLQLHSGYTFLLVHVFLGNWTHNLSLSWRNFLPLSHTGTLFVVYLNILHICYVAIQCI